MLLFRLRIKFPTYKDEKMKTSLEFVLIPSLTWGAIHGVFATLIESEDKIYYLP